MRKDRGQVALVVLVISAVALTLGLSLSKKTVVETNIETDEESLKQAFNAAESGIDYYLSTGTTKYTAPDGASKADVTVKDVGGTMIDFNEYTPANYYTHFWLVGHNSNGSINYNDYYAGASVDVCVNNSFAGSLQINYFLRNGGLPLGVFRQRKYVVNYGGASQLIPNPSVLPAGACAAGKKGVRVTLVGGGTIPLMISVSPVFDGAYVSLENVGGGSFPIQGVEITSLGRAGEVAAATGVSRKLSVVRRYRIPGFMTEAIASGGQILN